MTVALTIPQAAEHLGVSAAAVYYHAKSRPELFGMGSTGKTITLENLNLLRKRKQSGTEDAPAPEVVQSVSVPKPSPVPAQPGMKVAAANVRVQNVGFWCKVCGDLMPGFRLDCRCLWAELSPKAMEKHKAASWLPAHVNIHVTMEGANRR